MFRRTAALISTILLATAALATPVLASPDEEASFVSLINQERAGRGLNTLEVYWDLVDDARIHAGVMSDADKIFHSSNLASVTTGWSALGENVGVGPTVGVLHDAFMNSSGHRDNILGDWDTLGVGVTHSNSGYMYVTVVFMKSAEQAPAPAPAAPPPAPAPETEPSPAPETEPVQAVPAVAPVPAAAPVGVAATPPPAAPKSVAPAPTPEPDPEPEPARRLIDALLTGAQFPFSLV